MKIEGYKKAEPLVSVRPITAYEEVRTDMEIGAKVRVMRKAARISQEALGEILGIHQTALCRVEKGTQKITPAQNNKLKEIECKLIQYFKATNFDHTCPPRRNGKKRPCYTCIFRKQIGLQ